MFSSHKRKYKGEEYQDTRLGLQAVQEKQNIIESAAKEIGLEIEIEKITDYAEIATYGVAATPGIVIDGKVVHAGGLPKQKDALKWLQV